MFEQPKVTKAAATSAALAKALLLLGLLSSAAYGQPESRHTAGFVAVPGLASRTTADGAVEGCSLPGATFEIGQFEVTNTEYAQFLNSVARSADPFGLFSPLQNDHFWGGIVRSGVEGAYAYQVKPGYGRLPVTFVSWHDAVRFANWLHYGRPSTGSSAPDTTEGTSTSGAYDTSALPARPAGLRRNPGARYFIPSCGEWLAAGFFDPKTNAFTAYSNGESAPESAGPQAGRRSANFYSGAWALPFPHLAEVDAYENNQSPLGTRNQAGNVMEWVEGARGHNQLALGGSLFLPQDALAKGYKDSELPTKKLSSFGLRVARVGVQEELRFSASVAPSAPQQSHVSPPAHGAVNAWTTIDRPGNLSDYRTGFGCVAESFEMSRTEVTNEQYVAFLRAVARDGDEHRLYLDDMGSGVGGGITKTAVDGRVAYAVKPGFEQRPAAYLSWFMLARLANWYHFGQPAGRQALGTTEGDDQVGAYDTRGFASFGESGRAGKVSATLFTRNPQARYFIPSNDEWYKAAYFDPERKGLRRYWSYPSRSDSPPGNERSAAGANYQIIGLGEGGPHYVSRSGDFASRGYYDLVDLGGNLWEWLESWRGLGGEAGWRRDIPTKGLRGGSFNYIDVGLGYGNIDPGYPSDHYFVYGGRLARKVQSGPADTGWCLPASFRADAHKMLRRAGQSKTQLLIGALVLFLIAAVLLWRRRGGRSGRESARRA